MKPAFKLSLISEDRTAQASDLRAVEGAAMAVTEDRPSTCREMQDVATQ